MIEFNVRAHGERIATELGLSLDPHRDQVISRSDRHGLLGGVIYRDFTGASVQMHVVGFDPTWINKDMLWVAFHYPFEQLQCGKVFGQVPETNHHAIDFNRRLGFKEVVRIPGVYLDGSCVLMEMVRDDCKWLRIKPSHLQTTSKA